MMDLNTLNKLEELKKSMIIEENKSSNITKIEINIETQDYKDKNIFENKIYSKNVHSNFNSEVAVNNINNNKPIEVTRGQIYYMRLHIDIEGSEQGGKRPVIVIQNDIGNRYSSNIIVVPITSSTIKNPLPTHQKINGYGLTKDSTVLCEMPMTLSKKRIISYVGTVDELTMKHIDRAFEIATSKLEPKSTLERLPQTVQNMIKEKLEDIRSIERTICNIVINNESLEENLNSLEENLKGQRACYLASLERICKKYNLNYRDYYIMYKREKEDDRIVI